jgi:Flp pilus assembly protein TadG
MEGPGMQRLARFRPLSALRRFWRDRSGVAAAEFAIIASVLSVALLGGTELSRYTLMHQKMDRVSSSVSNMVAQSSAMTSTDFSNMYAAAEQIAKPFDLSGSNGIVIISFIVAESSTNYRIEWQRTGAGTLNESSKLGVEGDLATLPSGVTMSKGDSMVAVEVYAKYTAFVFPDLVGTSIVYHRSFDQPRLTDVITAD